MCCPKFMSMRSRRDSSDSQFSDSAADDDSNSRVAPTDDPYSADSRPRSRSPVAPTSPSVPHSSQNEQPKDDAFIIRLFSLIDNSITDHVLNYYIDISSDTESDKFLQFGRDKKELEWVLHAAPPSLLKEARTQVVVIRAIIGYEIFKAIQEDFFVPPPNKTSAAKKQDPRRRLSYFESLSTNPKYHSHREDAVDTLTRGILKMTQPLSTAVGQAQETAREMNLKAIVENAAEFSITIGKQSPSFEIIFPHSRAKKSRSIISRSNSRKRRGSAEEPETPVLVPELRKYGDERGKNYEQFLTLIPVQQFPEFS